MGLKINKLYIKNFKVFKEIVLDLSNKKLTVFDGPNGFGKTTLYDAIELIFTGEIRRYNDIADKAVKGSQAFDEMPFYYSHGDGTPIILKAEIEISDDSGSETKVLIRKTKDKEELLKLKTKHEFSIFKLYEAKSFDAEESEHIEISNENILLTTLLGENYKKNFEFLNYVEQEESYYLLKQKDKDRKNNIQHLFKTDDFEEQRDKITTIKKKVLELVTPLQKEIKELNDTIKKLEENLSKNEKVEFNKLFEDKEQNWDKEKIDFETITYSEIMSKDGILSNLENLILNRETFKTSLKNKEVQNVIDKKQVVLKQILKYDDFLEKKEDVLNEMALFNSIATFVKNSSKFDSKSIMDGLLDIDENISRRFAKKEELISYNEQLKSVKELIKNSDKTSKLHSDMSGTRNKLIEFFKQYEEETGEDINSCPLCGYNWETQQELLIKIGVQTYELEKLSNSFSTMLSENVKGFKEREFENLLTVLKQHTQETYYNEDYFGEFAEMDAEKIKKAKKYLQDNNIEYSDLISKDTNPEEVIKLPILISRLKEKIIEIDTQKLRDNFMQLYTMYFDENEQALFSFDVKELSVKRKYIDWQFSLYQSAALKENQQKIETKTKRLEVVNSKISELKSLEGVYKKSLTAYNKQVIKDIELLFHIYTGRILQDYQGGLGLFMKEIDGLRFVTNPNRTYDALFSMSAGQLSALIISFTLALNKIYSSKNKVLFIDDPVQTMDEINISGCIELLRNEFSDRQIFISTHESMMSTYMRYKFEKYNLSTKRINVKELTKN